jgi:HAD superfamily hydrolase (TIGR01509 family)
MTASPDLVRLLAETGPILLDFDGPVCSIFANYPAPNVANDLRALLLGRDIRMPEAIIGETDPLEVLRWTATLGKPELTRDVEDALRADELRAASSATPTPYAREVIVAARQAGRSVAIVSNNSEPAIAEYLTAHRLTWVSPVIGRFYAEPDRMKPSPEPILRAVIALDAKPKHCVLVGDSLTDITGSRAAGVRVIGYANKPPKIESFTKAGADFVVTSMAEVAAALLKLSAE